MITVETFDKIPGMKNVLFTIFITIVMTALISSCQNSPENQNNASSENDSIVYTAIQKPLREKVLTTEEQQALTPDMVIQSFKEGNRRFINNDLTARDHS